MPPRELGQLLLYSIVIVIETFTNKYNIEPMNHVGGSDDMVVDNQNAPPLGDAHG
jgi:hypothetical protein